MFPKKLGSQLTTQLKRGTATAKRASSPRRCLRLVVRRPASEEGQLASPLPLSGSSPPSCRRGASRRAAAVEWSGSRAAAIVDFDASCLHLPCRRGASHPDIAFQLPKRGRKPRRCGAGKKRHSQRRVPIILPWTNPNRIRTRKHIRVPMHLYWPSRSNPSQSRPKRGVDSTSKRARATKVSSMAPRRTIGEELADVSRAAIWFQSIISQVHLAALYSALLSWYPYNDPLYCRRPHCSH